MPASDPAREVVDAILAATPTDRDGDVIEGFDDDPDSGYEVRFGDPRPVAVRQAAAVLRWLDINADTWVYDPGSLRELADQIEAVRPVVGGGDRRCPDGFRPATRGTCTRHHCDRCGGHDPIRDKPGDFAVCRPCRAEMDADRPANQPNTVAEGDRP